MTNQNEVVEIQTQEVVVREPVTPMHMLQIAMDKGADLDRLEKLMEMNERYETNEARKAYVLAMSLFKANPPKISKNQKVSFGKTQYKHATLDHVADTIGTSMSQHGLSFTWDVEQNGSIKVTCIVTHSQGHSERVSLIADSDTSGSKNSIQAMGSTITYLQRYTLLSATGLAAKGDDDGLASEPPVEYLSEKQIDNIKVMLDFSSSSEERWLKYHKVGSFSEIPATAYAACIRGIEKMT